MKGVHIFGMTLTTILLLLIVFLIGAKWGAPVAAAVPGLSSL